MSVRGKQAIVIGVLALTLAVGGGVALAGGDTVGDRQAFLDDVAKRLGVTPAQLKAALEGAYGDRVDAAVAAGKITKEQAEAMKQRAEDGGLPLFGGHRFGGPGGPDGHHGGGLFMSLDAAATYLGVTEAKVHTELESGKSLADVAKAEGKSVDGLKKALSTEAKKKLDAAVKDGHLTQAQADALEARLGEHLDDIVNGTGGPGRPHDGHGWGGPPRMGSAPPAAYVPVPSSAAAA